MQKLWYDFFRNGYVVKSHVIFNQLVVSLLFLSFVWADLPSVKLEFFNQTQGEVVVGDSVLLELKDFKNLDAFEHHLDVDIASIDQETLSKGFIDPKLVNEQGHWCLKLMPGKPGEWQIPVLKIKNQKDWIVQTKPFLLKVLSVISPQDPYPDQMSELRSPLGLPLPIIWMTVIGLLFLILILILIYIFYRLVKNRRAQTLHSNIVKEKVSEDQFALERLLQLENSFKKTDLNLKIFYFQLSEILKEYLSHRFNCKALESTSAEIILLIKLSKWIDEKLLTDLIDLFEKLDLVKFTDWIPTQEEPQFLLQRAREWILQTRRPAYSVVEEADHEVR